MAEPGATLLTVRLGDQSLPIKLLSVGKTEAQISMPPSTPDGFRFTINGHLFVVSKRGDSYFVPVALLWQIRRSDFTMDGYSPKTDGWADPVQFLRQHRADTYPTKLLTLDRD